MTSHVQLYPDGFFVQVFVRPSVSVVINIDRCEGVENNWLPNGQRFGHILMPLLYKHYRRFVELPGARLTQMMVALGERQEPVMSGSILFLPDLSSIEQLLREQILPGALAWDIAEGLIPGDAVSLLSSKLAQEAGEGNKEPGMEFISLYEMMRRIVEGE